MSTKLVKIPLETYEKAVRISQERGMTIGGAIEFLTNNPAQFSAQNEVTPKSTNPPRTANELVIVEVPDNKPDTSQTINSLTPLSLSDRQLFQAYLRGRADQEQDAKIAVLEEALEEMQERQEALENTTSIVGQGFISHLSQHMDIKTGKAKVLDPEKDMRVMLEAIDPKFHEEFKRQFPAFFTAALPSTEATIETPVSPEDLELVEKPKRRGLFS
jgi:hypothetical protein